MKNKEWHGKRKPRVTMSFNAHELEFLMGVVAPEKSVTSRYLHEKLFRGYWKIEERLK